MATIEELKKAVCPDFPGDRFLVETYNPAAFYMINTRERTMYVPYAQAIRGNFTELESFSEAVNAFAVRETFPSTDSWDPENLELEWDEGDEGIALWYIEVLKKKYDLLACDIETRRLEWEDNHVISIGFAYSERAAVAITALTPKVIQSLQELFDIPTITFIWHNGKFDTTRLKYLLNVEARVDQDTLLMHYIGINEKRGTHGLKDLGSLYEQAPKWEDELDLYKRTYCKTHGLKLSDFMYDMIPIGILIPYMQRDVIATFRLYHTFKRLMRKDSVWIYNKVVEASNVYKKMELNGMLLDFEYMEEFEYELEQEIARLQQKVDAASKQIWDPVRYMRDTGAKSVSKEGFNMKSPKQLKWMLEHAVGRTIESTDADTLKELSEAFEDQEGIENDIGKQFVVAIAQLRKLTKYLDTYINNFRVLSCRDRRLRGSFNQSGTETGRIASSEPNMQNIPNLPKFRKIFKPADGYMYLQLDYSQVELRVLAMLSGDPWFTQVFIDGRDLHTEVALAMFGPDFTKPQRVLAKTINFGIAYGRGPQSIADKFGIPLYQAKKMIEDWYKPVPLIRKWLNDQRKSPYKGNDCITPFGRHRHFTITYENRNHVENESCNTPIQSCASDFTMLSMLRIDEHLVKHNIDAKLVMTIHDSIVLEIKDDPDLIEETVEVCLNIMRTTPELYLGPQKVPFEAEAEVGPDWGSLMPWHKCECGKWIKTVKDKMFTCLSCGRQYAK